MGINFIDLAELRREELIACVVAFGVRLGPFIVADCSTETMRDYLARHIDAA